MVSLEIATAERGRYSGVLYSTPTYLAMSVMEDQDCVMTECFGMGAVIRQ